MDVKHLTEEQLMEAALGTLTEKSAGHIRTCQVCAGELDEITKVKESLRALEDEEVPSHLEKKIFRMSENKKLKGAGNFLSFPFIITTVIFLMILALYMLVSHFM